MSVPHKDLALNVAISASLSLATMIVDFVWLIRDEAKYVWPRFRESWTARIYVLTRYVGIASQIYNVYFTLRMYLGIYTSPLGCRFWFAYQAILVLFLLVFVEGLLMHRIYALFLHNRLILVILILFALCQMASMGVSARLSFPSNKHTITCLMVRSNPGNAFFSATTMTTNIIIFFMTFSRYFRLPGKWTRQGLGRVVFRDSALSLSAISLMMLFLMLCSLEVIKPNMTGNITYYWLVCVLWISVGRIIVNHEKIPRDEGEQGEGSTWRGTLQLTSQIEMGQSALSVDTQCGSSDEHTPTSGTLQSSLSISMTKADQLSLVSPSTACPSDSSRQWLGDRHCSQSPTTESPTEASIRGYPQSNVCTGTGDAPQTEDNPQANTDPDEGTHSPEPHPQPSSPEMPPLEVSS